MIEKKLKIAYTLPRAISSVLNHNKRHHLHISQFTDIIRQCFSCCLLAWEEAIQNEPICWVLHILWHE